MGAVGQGQFGAGDWRDAGGAGRTSKLHRAVEAIVIGDGQGAVAELGGAADKLLGQGGAVEEGEGRVEVKLNVG